MNSQKPPADLNPFSEPLKSINETIARLVASEKKLACELQWYDSTDRQKLGEELRVQLAEAERLNLNLQTIDVEIAANQRDVASLSSSLGTLFNPKNWFAEDQRELRRKRRELVKVGERVPPAGMLDVLHKRFLQQLLNWPHEGEALRELFPGRLRFSISDRIPASLRDTATCSRL